MINIWVQLFMHPAPITWKCW